jgi:hypothetical protein
MTPNNRLQRTALPRFSMSPPDGSRKDTLGYAKIESAVTGQVDSPKVVFLSYLHS